MTEQRKYDITIGIECHVQLKTKTKLFSEVDNDARGKEPNSCVSPIDYALPGMLPRLNGEAVKLAIRAGAAMNARINPNHVLTANTTSTQTRPRDIKLPSFIILSLEKDTLNCHPVKKSESNTLT